MVFTINLIANYQDFIPGSQHFSYKNGLAEHFKPVH
jgi:hypothetical protein